MNNPPSAEGHFFASSAYRKTGILLLLLCFIGSSSIFGQVQNYSYYSDTVGIHYKYETPSDYGGGISWADFDGDGWDDFSFGSPGGEPLHIYKNVGGNLILQSSIPFADSGAARCLIWVDYDNDADKDLYVTHEYSANKLYRNDGNWNFTDVTLSSGMGNDLMYSYSACWGDYDNDGWLDCYVVNRNQLNINFSANRLYHNNQDGTFTEVALQVGVADTTGLGFSANFMDYNNDGLPDLEVTNDKYYSPNRLYENLGNGQFVDVSDTFSTGIGIDGMGTAIGDYDGNGYLDIYVTNTPWSSINFGGNVLCRNNGDGSFTEVGDSAGVRVNLVGWGGKLPGL